MRIQLRVLLKFHRAVAWSQVELERLARLLIQPAVLEQRILVRCVRRPCRSFCLQLHASKANKKGGTCRAFMDATRVLTVGVGAEISWIFCRSLNAKVPGSSESPVSPLKLLKLNGSGAKGLRRWSIASPKIPVQCR